MIFHASCINVNQQQPNSQSLGYFSLLVIDYETSSPYLQNVVPIYAHIHHPFFFTMVPC